MLWLHLELCAVPPCCRVVTLTVPPGSEPHFLKLLSHPLLTLSHFFLLEIFLTGWETFFRLLCLRIALFCRHMWLIICQFTESWNSNTPVFFCFAFVFIFVFFFSVLHIWSHFSTDQKRPMKRSVHLILAQATCLFTWNSFSSKIF